MSNDNLERRVFSIREIRASGEGEAPNIEGYAAVFNSLSDDLGGFVERIRPGAFTNSLGNDVRATFNHDENFVLGRTKAGTLELAEDEIGLDVDIDPPETTWARDLMASIKRGDVDQMSFMFMVPEGGDTWEQVGDLIIRTLIEVDLRDVAVVTYPAYPQTSAAVRSKAAEFKNRETQEGNPGEPEAPNARARLEVHREQVIIREKIKFQEVENER